MNKLKVGHNPFANMLPIFYFLDKESDYYQLYTDVPSGHNRLLSQGQIDMAPISAFEYGLNWEKYTILSDLSIAAKGEVGSILLFSRCPIEELNGKKVALSDMSATSVNLLKIVLRKFYCIQPIYTVMRSNLKNMLEENDAALLIADSAITALNEQGYSHYYDLGEQWLKFTGLPMVFSFWAVRDDILAERKDEVQKFHRRLVMAKEMGLENRQEIINYCIKQIGVPEEFWQRYFRNLRHDLEPDLIEGSKLYFSSSYKLGLIESEPKIKISYLDGSIKIY